MELSDKKKEILKVAEKLFAENGFTGTSVRKIAKEADINIAMISYYFGSKENLLKELAFYRSSDFRDELESLIAQEEDDLKKVDLIVEFAVRHLHRNRRIHKITNIEYAKKSNQVDFDHFINQKRKNYKLIEDFIKSGQEKGVFSKTVDIAFLLPTIVGTYLHVYYNKRTFEAVHGNTKEVPEETFVETQLIPHLQRTIKAMLIYEN